MILATPPAVEPLAATATLPADPMAIDDAGPVARDYLGNAQAELRRRHDAGAGGRAVVAAYTAAVDRLVEWLFTYATRRYQGRHPFINQRCAIVALGGYGRGELNPASDIDLLVLYPWKSNPYVETVTERVLYALWDAGMQVGHAMRNARECCRLGMRDMIVKTALLDARWIVGDRRLMEEFEQQTVAMLWSTGQKAFFQEKLAESERRHARAGNSVYLLQPQVKDGKGGLRDLHTAMWMAKVKFKVRRMRDLVPLAVLSERDIAVLDEALDGVWRIRNAMHFVARGHHDLLSFELQEMLAPALGFGPGRDGVERFMRSYYRHATTLHRVSETVIARCTQNASPYRSVPLPVRRIREGMRIRGDTLYATGRDVFERDPLMVLEIFAEAQRHGARLSPGTLELVRECLPLLSAHGQSQQAGQILVRILRGRAHVAATLGLMHAVGVLGVVLPEFGALECLIAHDPFHIYTVDQHSLMGVREIEALRAGQRADSVPHLTEVMRELSQPELVFLGMLLHDVGKGHGHDHSARGARMAHAVVTRLGLNEDEQAAVEFLVQHHLLMSHLAQRRDVRDDGLVIDFCRTVGTVDNLQRLYVLTYADMSAVAPGVWNNWRGTLVTELYRRAREVFDRGVFEPEDRGARAARVRERVIASVVPTARGIVSELLEHMPDGYILGTPEEVIPGHAELRRRLLDAEAAGERPALAVLLTPYPERDFTEIAICCRDRPGLFAMVSGVLTANRMNILAARINTSRDGIALDAFRVSHPAGEVAIDAARWERVESTLRQVLSGAVDVEELVRRSTGSSLLQRRRRPVPTRIEIDNRVSSQCTVLDVYTGDRVGLLFTITNCLYHLWLQIHLAKITTMVDQVLDVFYVTDHEGRKIEDPRRLAEIRAALEAALAPDVDALPRAALA